MNVDAILKEKGRRVVTMRPNSPLDTVIRRMKLERIGAVILSDDGETIEPSVSVPIANPTPPAVVAAAEPADEPLDPCSRFHGLRVMPPNQTSPQASSPRVSLAMSTAPA